ncbi:Pentatricopeptide repeat-containing protein [Platanthera zijinensis]|uniref:Pentatricopeptide repeat-containing protein n=1 Tax=Platanthera zijinensis TaxID=2320716 RepID=A0AAP0BHR9_9ASPA
MTSPITPRMVMTPPPPRASITLICQEKLNMLKNDLVSNFKRFSADRNFRSKPKVYEIIIRRLASAGRLDAIEQIIEQQKRYKEEISHEGFAVRLISLYGIAGMADRAAALFHELPALGLCYDPSPPSDRKGRAGDHTQDSTKVTSATLPREEPSQSANSLLFSFNAVLTAYTRSKDANRIAQINDFFSSHDASIEPNGISYNILINALLERGLLHDALSTLDLMEQRGIKPNLVTFNTLLNGFYRKGMMLEGDGLWKRMVDNDIQPDLRSFNAKIRGLCWQGKILEAMEVLESLSNIGLEPNTLTFNALIKAYCREEKMEAAKRVYNQMGKKGGCFPDRHTLRELVPKLCQVGEVDFALNICRMAIKKGFIVDVGIVQVMIDELAKASLYDKAKKLVKWANSKNTRANFRIPLSCLAP